jgi:hypothetical protein
MISLSASKVALQFAISWGTSLRWTLYVLNFFSQEVKESTVGEKIFKKIYAQIALWNSFPQRNA